MMEMCIRDSYEGIKLALNGICTIENTDHVDAGVAYNTNDANVQFQWKLYDLAEKKWSDITGWTTGNWMSWYPCLLYTSRCV